MSLAKLLSKYIEAEKELEDAKNDCSGTWGYYLHDETQKVENLEKQITKEIKELILEIKNESEV